MFWNSLSLPRAKDAAKFKLTHYQRFSICASCVVLIGVWSNYISHLHHLLILNVSTIVGLILFAISMYFYRKGM